MGIRDISGAIKGHVNRMIPGPRTIVAVASGVALGAAITFSGTYKPAMDRIASLENSIEQTTLVNAEDLAGRIEFVDEIRKSIEQRAPANWTSGISAQHYSLTIHEQTVYSETPQELSPPMTGYKQLCVTKDNVGFYVFIDDNEKGFPLKTELNGWFTTSGLVRKHENGKNYAILLPTNLMNVTIPESQEKLSFK